MDEIGKRLFRAVKHNEFDSALDLLGRGASANFVHLESSSNYNTKTPVLYVACQNENVALVELMLAHGADPNAEYDLRAVWGSEHEPCLFAAPTNYEITKALLENHADPNIPRIWREDRNNVVSIIARAWSNQEVVSLLREYGARSGGGPIINRPE